jgi:hypothetical protein
VNSDSSTTRGGRKENKPQGSIEALRHATRPLLLSKKVLVLKYAARNDRHKQQQRSRSNETEAGLKREKIEEGQMSASKP